MTRIILMIVFYLISAFARADNDMQSFMADAKLNRPEQLQDYTQYAIEAKKQEANVTSPYFEEAKLAQDKSNQMISDNKNNGPLDNDIKSYPSAIIFVSFSMSDESIASYLRDSKKIHASVVIRGLINNSFKDTFLKIASIVKRAGGGGLELNPPAFKKFSIVRVPAVVVLPSDKNIETGKAPFAEIDFDVVYGDIPLYNALKTVRDHGAVSQKKADELLSVLKDSLHE